MEGQELSRRDAGTCFSLTLGFPLLTYRHRSSGARGNGILLKTVVGKARFNWVTRGIGPHAVLLGTQEAPTRQKSPSRLRACQSLLFISSPSVKLLPSAVGAPRPCSFVWGRVPLMLMTRVGAGVGL